MASSIASSYFGCKSDCAGCIASASSASEENTPTNMDQDEGFEIVKSKKNKRSRGSNSSTDGSVEKRGKLTKKEEIPLQNKFKVLSNETTQAAPNRKHEIAPVNVIINENTSSSQKYLDLCKIFKEKSENGYEMKYKPIVYKLKDNLMSVRVSNLEDYRFLLQQLDKKKFEYYLFKREGERPQRRFVLKGLPKSVTGEEIIKELQEQTISAISVKQMKSYKDKTVLPLFLVTIDEQDTDKIKKIQSIAYLKIRLEEYIPPKGIKQCFNCQRFNHTARNCHATPRCFKCGMEHESRNCSFNEATKKEERKCVNCGENHFALYKGCPKYKEEKVSYAKKVIATNLREIKAKNYPIQNFQSHFPGLKEKHKPDTSKTVIEQKIVKKDNIVATKCTKVQNKEPETQIIHEERNKIQNKTRINNDINDLAELLQEACELAANIAARNITPANAASQAAKTIGRLLNLALKISAQNAK